jgi:hypothetical protein
MSIDSDIAALQATLAQFSTGITNFGGAIQAMQTAGNAAVGSIGPAIDALAAGNSQVMTITQRVWTRNGALAGVTSGDSATQDDLSSAKSILGDMVSQYGVAYRLAKSLGAPAKAAPPKVAAPPAMRLKPDVGLSPPPASGGAVALTTTGPAVLASPGGMASPSTAQLAAAGGGGIIVGLVGARVGLSIGGRVGLMVGGPVGMIIGAAAGYLTAKALHK